MSELEKATLTPISSDESARQLGDPVDVQFNPASLRLQLTNSTEGGESRGRQQRQYTGSSSTTLTLELVFDTADEGSTDSPRSVREKTAAVEQFIYPQGEGGNKQAPPKLRFQWGDLVLEGVVDSLTIDLDHFASNGVPLRAKVGFSFKEQDRRYEFLASGPGANRSAGAALAGGASLGLSLGASVGISAGVSLGISAQASVGVALGGESAAEFAARVGVDPAAWRGLSFEASAGGSLSFDAGIEVGFSAGLSASAGLGIQVGATAGASASVEASFGLEASASAGAGISAGAQASAQQGFALAAAGGVSSAIESVKIANTQKAEQTAREAFALPAAGASAAPVSTAPRTPKPTSSPKPALPDQPRTPMQLTGAATSAAPAPPPPKVDGRAASFGFGVPLRPVVSDGARSRSGILSGAAPVRTGISSGGVPVTSDPTTPLWVALRPAPAVSGGGTGAHPKGCSCGCSGGKR